MTRSLLPDAVERYVASFHHESPVQARLRAETARLPDPGMQIGPDQGCFMAVLVKLMGARQCLEIGTFTGYSALSVAGALPDAGRLITCDVSEDWTSIARRYWEEAGVARRIDLRLGPAIATLEGLLAERGPGTFDFAFIDADKPAYDAYYERCLRLVRPGGVILIDNVIWSGKIVDSAAQDLDTIAIRNLNAKIERDDRVAACLLTVGDGVMMVRTKV